MPTGQTGRFFHRLRRAVLLHDGGGLTDGELLRSFVEQRDETAFEALVRRHGPMVLGVCRRALGNIHDAEDAFQATFLILARKADSIVARKALGSWLFAVAYRAAVEARAKRSRWRAKEKQVEPVPHPTVEPEAGRQELRAALDRELSRLPERYRLPVVLCELEGRSRKEVARQLKLCDGTLSSRLATARKLLAKRLSRYGFTVGGGALAAALSQNAASACLRAQIVHGTVKAAALVAAGKTTAGVISAQVASITQGVLKAMLLTKLKITTAVLLVLGVVAAGTGVLTHRAPAADKPERESVGALQKELTAAKGDLAVQQAKLRQTAARVSALEDRLQRARQAQSKAAKGTVEATIEKLDAGQAALTVRLARADNRQLLGVAVSNLDKGGDGVAVADLDKDGDLDLFITDASGQHLVRNVKDGWFEVVTLMARGRGGVRLENLPLAQDLKIVVNGKPGKLADLKPGTRASLRLDVQGGITVTEIVVAK